MDKSGNYISTINGNEGSAGHFDCPHSIFIDVRKPDHELYIADRSNGRVQVYDLEGKFKRVFGNEFFTSPSGFATQDNIMVVAELKARLVILDINDKPIQYLGSNIEVSNVDGWPNNLDEKNLEKSSAWYQKAAAQGHDRATRALSRLHGTNRDNELPVTMSEGTTSTTEEPLNLQPPSPPADHEPKNVQTTQDKIHSDTKSLPGQVFMAHVASYRSIKQAKAGWNQLLVDHHVALHDAKMKISTITLPDEGLFYRVEVGPFLSLDKVNALCSTLEARQTYCRPIERKQ